MKFRIGQAVYCVNKPYDGIPFSKSWLKFLKTKRKMIITSIEQYGNNYHIKTADRKSISDTISSNDMYQPENELRPCIEERRKEIL